MVAGHLQQKKGYWYMVLNLYDEQGKRKSKWIATHLPVQGYKHRAEEMLLQTRQQYADSREGSELLFADYMLQWLEKLRGHWLWLPVLLSLFYGLRRVKYWACNGKV